MAAVACDISMNSRLRPEDRERFQNTKAIREILDTAKTIAIVGMSTELTKASNMVGSYLMDEGFTVIPVNPRATEILGQKCYPDLKSIPVPIDVVDVFRPPSEVSAIVDEAIAVGAKAVWTQLKIADLKAAARAQEAGLVAVADKCIKMEHGRFGGQLHWAGMNTQIVTAQRRRFAR
jgi:predicted CoA-binding protein